MNGAPVCFPGKFLKYCISFSRKEKMLEILWCAYFFCPTPENKQSEKSLPSVMDLFRNIIFKELFISAKLFFVLASPGQFRMCPGRETKHGCDSFCVHAYNSDTKKTLVD